MWSPSASSAPVPLGHLQVVGRNDIGRARGRRRDALAADLLDQVHLMPGLFQALGPAGVVVHDPFGKADRALDRQSTIGDSLLQVGQRTALLDVLLDFADPRLDRLVAGLGDDIDFFHQRQFLPADRTRVEAIAKIGHGS